MKYFQNIKKKITPAQIIALSFMILILVGALLLNLPISSNSNESIGFLDALFTATSAVCVTGLVTANTATQWTVFGKIVVIGLVQIGGLSLMTVLTLFMILIRKKISLKDRLVIQASYNQSSFGDMVRLVKNVIQYTFLIELAGAILLSAAFFSTAMPLRDAIYNGLFHAVSAFCNAGFDVIGAESLAPFRSNLPINIIIMSLIIAGGLGFTVLAEIHDIIRNKQKCSLRKRLHHLSLHAKIAITVTIILLLSGTVLFLMLEWTNSETLAPLPLGEKITAAVFQSVTLRTAGFFTIDQGGLTEASLFVSCILMLIGGSPAGIAGGMKTVTFGVIIIAMISVLKGRDHVGAFGRILPINILQKALTVACTMLIVVITSTLILSFTEKGMAMEYHFLDLMFECSSAVATVGNSTGITPHLTHMGKLVIIVGMFLGRLSPVTVVVALNMRLHAADNSTSFVEESAIIG